MSHNTTNPVYSYSQIKSKELKRERIKQKRKNKWKHVCDAFHLHLLHSKSSREKRKKFGEKTMFCYVNYIFLSFCIWTSGCDVRCTAGGWFTGGMAKIENNDLKWKKRRRRKKRNQMEMDERATPNKRILCTCTHKLVEYTDNQCWIVAPS